jgi:2'-5' RNA ligase
MGEIRAFIAIELPNEVKTNLSTLLGKLKPGHERTVKWVDPNSIHLTLKFLGNIPENKIVDITQAITNATQKIRHFSLSLQGLGTFPNLRSPKVAWVGIGGDVEVVTSIHRQIDRALVPLGFASEKRSFSPHLTLGRVRDKTTNEERSDLGKAIESIKVNNSSPFSVDRVSLMQSTLTKSGAIYDQISIITLDKN